MRIKITSDSTCDLSPELIEEHGIALMPLSIIKGDKTFSDGIDITPANIFAHVAAGGALCTTAAVNTAAYHDFFENLSPQYDAVVHISIGSGFSSSHQNACLAAADFENIHVIDSCNLSTGQGHVVLEACKLAKDCTDIAALCQTLRALTGRIEASFLLDRLDYMVKGGRCSSVMALGANLLNLKPCLEVVDGKLQVGKKYRGKYAKCLADYVKDKLGQRNDVAWDTLFITYTPLAGDALESVRQAVRQHGSRFAHIYETQAGCSISCHCGEGTLGVLFIRSH